MSDFTEMRVCLEKVLARLDRLEKLILESKESKEVEYKFSFEPTFEGQGEMVLPEDLVYEAKGRV